MKTCNRCGSDDVSWSNDEVRLYGGVTANLCPACMTEWDRILKAEMGDETTLISARKAHYTSLAMSRSPIPETLWVELFRREQSIEDRAYELGLGFVRPIGVAARDQTPEG